MKKNKLLSGLIAGLALASLSTAIKPHQAKAYTIDKTYLRQRSWTKTTSKYIIAHETGTYATALQNAQYFDWSWNSNYAYTAYIVGDGGKVYQVAPEGFVQWGAGSVANASSPVQIELARTTNAAQFAKDYPVYVNLLRDSAKRWGAPVKLDGSGNGIKSHLWVTENLWGTHYDPFTYLESRGVSRAQFAKDLTTGLSESGQAVKPSTPATPTPSTNVKSFTFKYNTNVRVSPSTSAAIVGQYKAGETVNYTSTVTSGGYTWAKYTSYSGAVRYAAMINGAQTTLKPSSAWVAQNGKYTLSYATVLRYGASTSSGKIATIGRGSVVKYNAFKIAGGYVWIRQVRGNGYGYLATGQAVNGRRVNYWGTFK